MKNNLANATSNFVITDPAEVSFKYVPNEMLKCNLSV